ncbi:spore germination protein GerPC [Bacillus kwashiorkori]|uniref:spore germination protein GerPC n=1 Tax=Bacillus kwashiorkori TaxID=1522318 RepID=UPI000780CE99|nr:spore germination protein GerPC [Bacillus kwashiorkori]
MTNDIYLYLHELANYIKKQDKKIKELESNLTKLAEIEKSITKFKQSIEAVKNKPPVHIERIDYHFDQLKIERLEGTLNIGLNPQDIEALDEFAIGEHIPAQPSLFPHLVARLESELQEYVQSKVPTIVEETKRQFNIELDESYTELIKQDIMKQLPGRIQFYIQRKQTTKENRSEEVLIDEILSSIQQDIEQAIQTFLLPFGKKGEDKGEGGLK